MNPTSARGLVPPRPNLGPDPWSEAQSISLLLVIAAIIGAVFVVALIWRRLARRRFRAGGRNELNRNPPDSTPRGRLVAHSDGIRDVLAEQFGAAWRAKTTEEISAEPSLKERLGDDLLQELTRFLDQVDRLKFAPERSSHRHDLLADELATWEPRLADFNKKIRSVPDRRAPGGNGTAGSPPSAFNGIQASSSAAARTQ